MSELVNQEGDFKIKSKPRMKKMMEQDAIIKVDLTNKKEKDAVQEQTTDEGVLRTEQSEVGLQQ